jgi:hypothetical protein
MEHNRVVLLLTSKKYEDGGTLVMMVRLVPQSKRLQFYYKNSDEFTGRPVEILRITGHSS